jgi:hypothetical protein
MEEVPQFAAERSEPRGEGGMGAGDSRWERRTLGGVLLLLAGALGGGERQKVWQSFAREMGRLVSRCVFCSSARQSYMDGSSAPLVMRGAE